MSIETILALVAATAILVLIPGPNIALIVANTLARGFRFGAATVIGTTCGVALQLGAVVLGLAALLELAAEAMFWIKWIGVGYLVYLGIVSWRSANGDAGETVVSHRPLSALFWQGFVLATINPKTLLFNAAFLPQFIGADMGPAALATAAAVYLGVIFCGDTAWALLAHRARPAMLRLGRYRHKLTGAFYIGSGLGLALARSSR